MSTHHVATRAAWKLGAIPPSGARGSGTSQGEPCGDGRQGAGFGGPASPYRGPAMCRGAWRAAGVAAESFRVESAQHRARLSPSDGPDGRFDLPDLAGQRPRTATAMPETLRHPEVESARAMEQLDFEAPGARPARGLRRAYLRVHRPRRRRRPDGTYGSGKTRIAIAFGIGATQRRHHLRFRKAAEQVRDLL